jgi:hypothetical protein
MFHLTVLYNLPPHQDEDGFLEWRLGEHQSENMVKISDPVFLVSERLIGESSDTTRGRA